MTRLELHSPCPTLPGNRLLARAGGLLSSKDVKPPQATLSLWLGVAAGVAAAARKDRLAGFLLLVVGLGYAGLVAERLIEDDLRQLPRADWSRLDARQAAIHAATAWLGWRIIRR